MSKTTTLHEHNAFLYISLLSLHNNDVKWPHFKFTWVREQHGDEFYPRRGPLSSPPTKIPFF